MLALCEAYNDYVYDHYVKVSERLKPIAIIPPQDPERTVIELRRAVKQLGYRAAVVRTTGLRLPLGHRFYDPIYREAENLDCAIAVHGTNGGDELASGGFGTFTEVHTTRRAGARGGARVGRPRRLRILTITAGGSSIAAMTFRRCKRRTS